MEAKENQADIPELIFDTSHISKVSQNDVLLPFSQVINQLADYEMYIEDPVFGQSLSVESIKIDMPVEIRVSFDDNGEVALKGSAPTQRTETTILPVFHRIKIQICQDNTTMQQDSRLL
ncbi:hypothetical protein NIES4071_29510 [Calothrix sp. NIES-4071]|nr:hypothetical protein NIES4071_29510 [Calothrix sp. NIES-4071]BAZ57271.1 hypothetical protein NIES4105_29450 [Calothrix sp. NIES-4105]